MSQELENAPFEIVCCLSSHDTSTYYHLTPIAKLPSVSKLWIVRARKSAFSEIPKSEYVLAPSRFKLWRFVQMLRHCLRLGKRESVRAFVSFNPIPYGFIAMVAAFVWRKPIHLGFIGSDWNVHGKGRFRKWLRPFFRRAALITAPGKRIRDEMIAYGLDSGRVAVLPNAIDLDRYPVADLNKARGGLIFVGELVALKRVDLVLKAFAELQKSHPDTRLCIVGDGPMGPALRDLAEALGVAKQVEFVGFVQEVYPYLADARIALIASEMEGFPFALVEAMAAGLVPVCTPVGSIPDVIIDGYNGLLFPVGDAEALAGCVLRLLDEPGLYDRLRENVLATRQEFSFGQAASVWAAWLRHVSDPSNARK